MKKEVGRWTQADGSIRVQYEESLGNDFGQRQSFETLPPDSSYPEEATTAELTPGQIIASIGSVAANTVIEQADSEL